MLLQSFWLLTHYYGELAASVPYMSLLTVTESTFKQELVGEPDGLKLFRYFLGTGYSKLFHLESGSVGNSWNMLLTVYGLPLFNRLKKLEPVYIMCRVFLRRLRC